MPVVANGDVKTLLDMDQTGMAYFHYFNNIYKLQDLCGFDHQTDISVFHSFDLTEIKLLDFEYQCGLALEL